MQFLFCFVHSAVYCRVKVVNVIVQVEGKGNGIKTVIANMSDIARALSRPPTCTFVVSTFYSSLASRFIMTELV